jgi:20S proteasome alpha/beta subunit
MSLAINATIPEGIVLAADSRQSYRNRRGMARIGSDNASKLFPLNQRMAVAVTGLAFLPENGVLKSVSNYIKEFINKNQLDQYTVEKTSNELVRLFV